MCDGRSDPKPYTKQAGWLAGCGPGPARPEGSSGSTTVTYYRVYSVGNRQAADGLGQAWPSKAGRPGDRGHASFQRIEQRRWTVLRTYSVLRYVYHSRLLGQRLFQVTMAVLCCLLSVSLVRNPLGLIPSYRCRPNECLHATYEVHCTSSRSTSTVQEM